MTINTVDCIGPPEFPVWEALAHIADVIGDRDLNSCYSESRRQFRQAALHGKFEVWGRKATYHSVDGVGLRCSDSWSRIDPLYWQHWSLNERSVRELREDDAHTEADVPVTVGLTSERYWGIRVCQNAISKVWLGL